MSRKADCYENAPMESFFHPLKTEFVHHRHYATRQQAKSDIFAYIKSFYNRTRRHSAIGSMKIRDRLLFSCCAPKSHTISANRARTAAATTKRKTRRVETAGSVSALAV